MQSELPEANCSSAGPKRPAVLQSQIFNAAKTKAPVAKC